MWSKWIFVALFLVLLLVDLADAKPQKKQQKHKKPQKKQMKKKGGSGKTKSGGGTGKGVEFTNYGPYFSLPVEIGSNKDKVNLGVDGFYGSTVVYGPGTECDGSDSYCIQHNIFNNKKSSTFKPANGGKSKDFEFSLGTGYGLPADDDFTVGPMSLKPTMFATLSSIPRFLNRKTKNSGHIAMWAPEDTEDMKTTMQKLVELNDQKTITFYGPEDQNDMHAITFGREDLKHCKTNWATFKNIKKLDPSEEISPWTVQWNGWKWGEHTCNEKMNVAFNPGSNYFVAPRRHAEYFYSTLGAKHSSTYSGGMVDCSKRKTAPKLILHAGSQSFVITPKQYIKQFDSNNCLLNIYPDSLDQWTMPYMFHQMYCVKYNYGDKTVSIADSKKFS